MLLANFFSNPFYLALIIVAIVAIVTIILVNSIIDSKVKSYGKKDVAEKEKNLKQKLGMEDTVKEEKEEPTSENEVTDDTSEVEEEKTPNTAETITEDVVAEEVVAEEKKEVEEEKKSFEKDLEETEQEETDNIHSKNEVEEEVEELPNEEEKVEETSPSTSNEEVENKEIKEEKTDLQKEVEDLLKDVPDVNDVENKEEVMKETKKVEIKKETIKAQAKKPAKSIGKWILVPEANGYYFGKLQANNGEVILVTERYKGVSGLKNGIETIRKNIEKDNFEITVDKNKKFNFKLYALNNSLLCIGEGYPSRESALSAIQSVKNFAGSPDVVSDEAEITQEKQFSIEEDVKTTNGKWIIVDDEEGYCHAELKASNGQVLLVTEKYKGINSLKSGLDALKKNILAGNFGTRKDKNGNYNFKIFSEVKRLLAIGAGYSSLTNCESAIYSVMKFASSNVIFNDSADVE